jgi:hypothetical protein
MEINFFLDKQQIKFDTLTTEVGAEIEKVEEFDELSSRKSVSEDLDDSLLDGDLEEEEGDELQLQEDTNENDLAAEAKTDEEKN